MTPELVGIIITLAFMVLGIWAFCVDLKPRNKHRKYPKNLLPKPDKSCRREYADV